MNSRAYNFHLRPTSETTNSLSFSDRIRSILGIFSGGGRGGSRDTRVRERVSADKLGAACLGHSVSHPTLGPLGQPERAIGHESQVELWSPLDRRSALLVSEFTGIVAKKR